MRLLLLWLVLSSIQEIQHQLSLLFVMMRNVGFALTAKSLTMETFAMIAVFAVMGFKANFQKIWCCGACFSLHSCSDMQEQIRQH